MMLLHAPNQIERAALILGCCLLLGGCSVVRKSPQPLEAFPWETEMGTAEHGSATLPPEASAMGHYLTAEVALNQGDQEVARREYELAVAADPDSSLLRQRMAMLYVRANRLPEALENANKAVALDPSNVQSRVLL